MEVITILFPKSQCKCTIAAIISEVHMYYVCHNVKSMVISIK